MRGSRVKFSELVGARAARTHAILRVYTVLCDCLDEIALGEPYDSADATPVGTLADGVHQRAETVGLLLLRRGRRRPVGRCPSPGPRSRRPCPGDPQSLSLQQRASDDRTEGAPGQS